jgi:uncharacterized protein YecE (DUF72 family)
LKRLADDFGVFPMAVEVRHDSWDCPEAREALRTLGVGCCNIDQPALDHCIGPGVHVTSPIGYVRLHGRRRDTWFAANAEPHERYDYLYSPSELTPWAERVRQVADEADTVFVFGNNHFLGKGPANALQLRSMVRDEPVPAPQSLRSRYPDLRPFTVARPGDDRTALFAF